MRLICVVTLGLAINTAYSADPSCEGPVCRIERTRTRTVKKLVQPQAELYIASPVEEVLPAPISLEPIPMDLEPIPMGFGSHGGFGVVKTVESHRTRIKQIGNSGGTPLRGAFHKVRQRAKGFYARTFGCKGR